MLKYNSTNNFSCSREKKKTKQLFHEVSQPILTCGKTLSFKWCCFKKLSWVSSASLPWQRFAYSLATYVVTDLYMHKYPRSSPQ